jgi:peptidoglycan/LPS O-acetylase OafA/YrhL
MGYVKPFNSLKAIAVLLIIGTHWLDSSSLGFQLGIDGIGINMLFVISSFLTTRILLEHREQSVRAGIPPLTIAGNFYSREVLRFFPIYYLLVFALMIYYFAKNTSIADFYAYLTFTSNLYFYNQHVFTDPIPHVWPLAVGVQFYLVWPWVLLFINRKYLFSSIIGCIVIGIITQYIFRSVTLSSILPFTCLDCLGMGALLSWVVVYRPFLFDKFYNWAGLAALVSLVIYGWFIYQGQWQATNLRTCTGVITLWLMTYLLRNNHREKSKWSYLFHHPVLLFLGKISFGLYLYHLIIPQLVDNDFFWYKINAHLPDALLNYLLWFYLGECATILIIVSVLSYYIIEKPLLSFKKSFDLDPLRSVTQYSK